MYKNRNRNRNLKKTRKINYSGGISSEDTSFYSTIIDNPMAYDMSYSPEESDYILKKIVEEIGINKNIIKNTKNPEIIKDEKNNLKLLLKITESPYKFHLENYILLDNLFLSNEDIIKILPQNINNIIPRRLLTLLVFYSRESPEFTLRKNPEKQLIKKLSSLFVNNAFTSLNIRNVFEEFININKSNNLIDKILNGSLIYQIYKKNYYNKNNVLSESLIENRTKNWLENKEIINFPISYIFNIFTDSEKEKFNKDSKICKIISGYSNKMGLEYMPKSILNSNEKPKLKGGKRKTMKKYYKK